MEVIQTSRRELRTRRDKILCELGTELSGLKALAAAADLRDDQWLGWEEVEALSYLIGDDRPDD